MVSFQNYEIELCLSESVHVVISQIWHVELVFLLPDTWIPYWMVTPYKADTNDWLRG